MANELLGIDKWIVTTLATDAALFAIVGNRIFESLAPQIDVDTENGTAPVYPIVLFQMQSVSDSLGSGASRVMTSALFFVKVVGERGGYADLQAACDRIDALLHQAAITAVTVGAETFTILGSCRERPVQYAEVINGVRFNYLGGLYRIDIE